MKDPISAFFKLANFVRSHIYVHVSYELYMGCENTTILIAAYDEQVLLPLLMEVYKSSLPFLKNLKHLNPQMVAILETCFTPLTQLPTHGQRLLENKLMATVDIQLMQTLANVLNSEKNKY